jgi:hypothetical protein
MEICGRGGHDDAASFIVPLIIFHHVSSKVLNDHIDEQPNTYEQTESSKHLWNQDEGLAIIRRAFTYLHASGAGGCGQGRPV